MYWYIKFLWSSESDFLAMLHKGGERCTYPVKLIVHLFQKKILEVIDSLCAHLPEPAAKVCKDDVDKMLPIAITFVTGMAVRWRPDSAKSKYKWMKLQRNLFSMRFLSTL